MQGQRDAEAGEDQGGGIGDRGLERGDHPRWRVASTIRYWAVKHRRRGRGQHAQPRGRVTKPQAGAVTWPGSAHPRRVPTAWRASRTLAAAGAGGLVRVSRRQGVMGRSPGLWASGGGCSAHGCCHGVTIPFQRE